MSLPALELPAVDQTPPAQHEPARRLALRAPLIAAAIALVAGFVVVNTLPVGGFYDDAFYVILAKSLATGHSYRNLNLPGAPFATHYPPGYPLLLAGLWCLGPAFPTNLVLFKIANALFLGIAAAFACRLGQEQIGLGVGVTLVAIAAGTATTPALYLSSMVLSETMFLGLALPFVFWAERRIAAKEHDVRGAMYLGVCAGLLFLVRSQAIALIGAVVIVYALRRRWRESIIAAVAASVVIGPWLFWVAAHENAVPALMRGDYGSYFAWFKDGLRDSGSMLVLETMRRNIPDMVRHIAFRLQPPSRPLPDVVASLCVLLFAALGAARLARRAPLTLLFLAGYLGIAAVWPFPSVRFLLGVWVFLMLLLAAGVQTLMEDRWPNAAWHRPRVLLGRRIVGAIASAILVGGAIAYNVRGFQRRGWATTEEQSWRWIGAKVPWIVTRTRPSDVIATDHDEGAIYLYTDRQSVPLTTFTAVEYLTPRSVDADAAALHSLTDHYKPNYLVVSSVRLRAAAAALSVQGAPLEDGVHQIVPWVFTPRH